jgi:methionyl-tRNA formyltransferase
MSAKIGFVTCVELGLSCINAIYRVGSKLDLVITLDDHCAKFKSGRIYLDASAEKMGFKIIKTDHINNEAVIREIAEREIDWLFIIGWSQIANKRLLYSAKKGVLGMHPTLLPEGRGRASIPWAIIKGLSETGVTLFKLDEGVDTGDIIDQERIVLNDRTTATDLYEAVKIAHIALMERVIRMIKNDEVVLNKQDESKATYWPQRRPVDGEINLSGSVHDAERLIRALTKPYPGAFVVDPSTGCRKIIWSGRVLKADEEFTGDIIEFVDGYYRIIDHSSWLDPVGV